MGASAEPADEGRPTVAFTVAGDGNGWVRCSRGHRHWGRFGAAGLLLRAPKPPGARSGPAVLLQHRAVWSHHGGTWGLPGGARDSSETAEQTALREAVEEAGLDIARLRLLGRFVDDHGGWSYTTVFARTDEPLELTLHLAAHSHESIELRWVAEGDVTDLPLHPGLADVWPRLRLLADQVDEADERYGLQAPPGQSGQPG